MPTHYRPPAITEDLADIREFGSISGDICGRVVQAIAAGKIPYIPPGRHYWGDTVTLSRPARIVFGQGGPSWGSEFDWRQDSVYRDDRCVLWVDENIDFFVIESVSVHLDGGCFDVRESSTYDKAIFRYKPYYSNSSSPPFRETHGQYDGSIRNFWVVGDKNTLGSTAGTGARCIFLDWENSPSNAFMYAHNWSGRADRVHSVFSETAVNQSGLTGQNTAWNEGEFFVWGAKQALIVNAQNRSRFKVHFQPQYGLHSTEQELPVVKLNTSGNMLDLSFVDLSLAYSATYGHSNRKTIDTVQGNHIRRTTSQENYLTLSSAVQTGVAVHSQPTGVVHQSRQPGKFLNNFQSELHNQLIGFDKRGTFNYGYYDGSEVDLATLTNDSASEVVPTLNTISLAQPTTLFRNHGYRSSIEFSSSNPDDYIELVFDWPAQYQGRYQRFCASLTGPTAGGIKKYQVVQIATTDAVVTNKTFDLPASSSALGAFRDLECFLDDSVYTERLIVRFIGSHTATASFPIQDIAIYDDRRALPTYLPITGGTVHGTVNLDGLSVKDAGGTHRTIQPKTAGTPADLAALVALLKTTGIIV